MASTKTGENAEVILAPSEEPPVLYKGTREMLKWALPEGFRLQKGIGEKKSKRIQLVLQQSLYDEVKRAAKENDISVNEFAHRAFREMLKK